MLNPWKYKGEVFDDSIAENFQGFVYCLTDLENNKKYIGKKNFWRIVKRPPLKGMKRKRLEKKPSDWKTYTGSSVEVNELVESEREFSREIIHLCRSKGEMTYYEAKEQFDRGVLLKPDEYYNAFIGLKLHRNHILKLVEENG